MTGLMRQRERPSPPVLVGFLALFAALLVLCLALVPRAEAYVYWAHGHEAGWIGRANLDGTVVRQRFIDAKGPFGVAVDAERIYWTGGGYQTIARANLEGTNVDPSFIAATGWPYGIAVDPRYLYWADYGETIARANLDGTGVDESFITGPGTPASVAVDANHVYWANRALGGVGSIGRANLDGSDVDQGFINGIIRPTGVAVDESHLYWTSDGGGVIGRADLDGTDIDQSFVEGVVGAAGIAVDADHVYWANQYAGSIGRANLDGTDVNQSFITGVENPWGIAVGSGNSGPPPEITELRLSPKGLAADPAPTPLARARGTQIKLGLSKDAEVHFRVRHDPPRSQGGPAPEDPHVFTRPLDQGKNRVPFTGTLGNRTFSPGRYLLIARARDSANQPSERVSAKFRIKG